MLSDGVLLEKEDDEEASEELIVDADDGVEKGEDEDMWLLEAGEVE